MVPPQKERSHHQKTKKDVTLLFSTTAGDFIARIYLSKVPEAGEIFLHLVKDGKYNGSKFFRVEKNPFPYLIQTGAPLDNPHLSFIKPKIIKFNKLPHWRGSIAMAIDPISGGITSQFYILLSDAPYLDGKDPVIGEIVEGMNVVEKIRPGDRINFIRIRER